MFLTLPIQPAKEFLARDNNAFANLNCRKVCAMRELVSSGSGNAKGGSNISFPPYLQLAPRRWGQRGQSVAALTARGRGLDCFQPQSRLPTVRFSLAGSSLPGLRARRARFPTCGVVRVAGYSVVWACDPTSIFFPKSTKRSAAAIFGRSAPSLRFMVRFGIFCCRQDFLPCFTR